MNQQKKGMYTEPYKKIGCCPDTKKAASFQCLIPMIPPSAPTLDDIFFFIAKQRSPFVPSPPLFGFFASIFFCIFFFKLHALRPLPLFKGALFFLFQWFFSLSFVSNIS